MKASLSKIAKFLVVSGVLTIGTASIHAPALAQTDPCAIEADAYCSMYYTPGTQGYQACRHAKLLACANGGG